MKRLLKILFWLIGLGAVAGLTVWLGNLLNLWTGFPHGSDAYGHITKIKYVLDWWPNTDWYYQWAMGMPHFLWYAPLPYYFGASLVKVFSVTPETSLNIIGLLSYLSIFVGIYGSVYTLAKNHLTALLSFVLAAFSAALWGGNFWGGVYPRTLSLGFSALFLWFLFRLILKVREKKWSKLDFILAIFFLAIAMQAHILGGVFMTLVLLILILFTVPSWKQKIFFFLKIYLPAFLLSAYLYIPLIFFQNPSSRFLGALPVEQIPVTPLNTFFDLNMLPLVDRDLSLFTLLLPLLGLLLVAYLLKKIFVRKLSGGLGASVISLLIIFFCFSIYAIGPRGSFFTTIASNISIWGLEPKGVAVYLIIFGAILIGALLGQIFFQKEEKTKNKKMIIFSSLASLVLLLASVWIFQRNLPNNVHAYASDTRSLRNIEGSHEFRSINGIEVPAEEKDYRFATNHAEEAVWFNYLYDVPQTRDYHSTGILIPDFRYHFEQAVWAWEDNLEEVEYFMDWYAVKWLNTVPGDSSEKFLSLKNKYELISQYKSAGGTYYHFEYEKPTKITVASNALAVLIVGKKKASFDTIYRSLAKTGIDSQQVIPVVGGEYIDDYSLEELNSFEAVVLFEHKIHNNERAFELLSQYVEGGGGVIVEASETAEPGSVLASYETFPLSNFELEEREGEWSFQASKNEITEGIDFTSFSPAKYGSDPWRVRVVVGPSLNDSDCETVLKSKNDPVMMACQKGEGRVIFSGLKLPYHSQYYNNEEEYKLFSQMVLWAAQFEENTQTEVASASQFINPQERTIDIEEEAKGVVFKEAYFPNWQAYLETDKGSEKLKIEKAGPGLMYVRFPAELNAPAKLTLKYKKSIIENSGMVFSLATILVLIIYLLEGKLFKPFLAKPFIKFFSIFKKNVSGWWENEE